jgi:hypothetical protein
MGTKSTFGKYRKNNVNYEIVVIRKCDEDTNWNSVFSYQLLRDGMLVSDNITDTHYCYDLISKEIEF